MESRYQREAGRNQERSRSPNSIRVGGTSFSPKSSSSSSISALFPPHMLKEFEKNFIDTGPKGIDVCHIRTGGHFGLNVFYFYNLNRPSIALCVSAITQLMVEEKVKMVTNGPTRYSLEIKDEVIYLPILAHHIIRTVNELEWRSQILRLLPFTKDQIRESCVRTATHDGELVAPNVEQLEAMANCTFNEPCRIYIGRYLTCYNDPVIIAYGLLNKKSFQKMCAEVRDGIVRIRFRQMLLGAACEDANIFLEWEEVDRALPRCHLYDEEDHISDDAELIDVMNSLCLPTENMIPQTWNVPDIIMSDTLYAFKSINYRLKNYAVSTKVAVAIGDEKVGYLKGIKYSEHLLKLNFPTLLYRIESVGGIHDDLFQTLDSAFLVNRLKWDQEIVESKYGPIDLKRNDLHLTLCSLVNIFFRSFVHPFTTDYLIGTMNSGPLMSVDMRKSQSLFWLH